MQVNESETSVHAPASGRAFALEAIAPASDDSTAASVAATEESEDSKQVALLAARLAKMPANFSFGRSQISRR